MSGSGFCTDLWRKGSQGSATKAVVGVVYGTEVRRGVSKHAAAPSPFISTLGRSSINCVVVVRVTDMKLVWIDADYRTYA